MKLDEHLQFQCKKWRLQLNSLQATTIGENAVAVEEVGAQTVTVREM